MVDTIAGIVNDQPADGITISGGEPSDQAPAVIELITGLRHWAESAGRRPDVLMYSGRSAEWLTTNTPELLAAADALIPEPFLANQREGGRWRGSANQPILTLSDLGRERYPAEVTESKVRDSMQVAVTDGTIWLIGIPRRGDLDDLVERAARRGVEIREPSWRA